MGSAADNATVYVRWRQTALENDLPALINDAKARSSRDTKVFMPSGKTLSLYRTLSSAPYIQRPQSLLNGFVDCVCNWPC